MKTYHFTMTAIACMPVAFIVAAQSEPEKATAVAQWDKASGVSIDCMAAFTFSGKISI